MEHFILPLVGGALIGLSASLLFVALGRVAGVSGIVGSLVAGTGSSRWRFGFVLGLVAIGVLSLAGGPTAAVAAVRTSPWVLLVAGLLVGFGTRLGNGCTSGHGVCGLSRLSVRSAVATSIFIGVAALTVLIVRHLPGAGT